MGWPDLTRIACGHLATTIYGAEIALRVSFQPQDIAQPIIEGLRKQ